MGKPKPAIWRILSFIGFNLAIFSSQAIWLTFASIATGAAKVLEVDVVYVGCFVVIYPVMFIPLAIPSGRLLDVNLEAFVSLGVLLTFLGGLGRLLNPLSYPWLFTCQLMAATGQPFLLNAMAPFARRFFPQNTRPIAIAVSSIAMYAGMMYPMALMSALWQKGVMVIETSIAIPTALSLLFFAVNLTTPIDTDNHMSLTSIHALKRVIKFNQLWSLGGVLGYELGISNSIMTWLQPVLNAVNLEDIAGFAVTVMLVSGLIGSGLLPKSVAMKNKRTFMLRISTLCIAFVTALLAIKITPFILMSGMALIGFLMMAAYPILIEWIEHTIEGSLQGTATGFVTILGRMLSVVVIFVLQPFLNNPSIFFALMSTVTSIGLIMTLKLPSNF